MANRLALHLQSPGLLRVTDEVGKCLPHGGYEYEYSEWQIQFYSKYNTRTFDSLAVEAAARYKKTGNDLEVGELVLAHYSGYGVTLSFEYEIPLFLGSSVSKQTNNWRLYFKLFYRSVCEEGVGKRRAANARANAREPSTSSFKTLLTDADLKRVRQNAARPPPAAPPSTTSLTASQRLQVHFFYEAACSANKLNLDEQSRTRNNAATHGFVENLPCVSDPLQHDPLQKMPTIPLILTDVGRFNGHMTLTNDAQIDWVIHSILRGHTLLQRNSDSYCATHILCFVTAFYPLILEIEFDGLRRILRWTKHLHWKQVRLTHEPNPNPYPITLFLMQP